MEGKKSFFELTCKTRLKSGTEKKKKILKSLLVAKEDCQAFGLLGNKEEKLAEVFQYQMYLYLLQLQNQHNVSMTKQD